MSITTAEKSKTGAEVRLGWTWWGNSSLRERKCHLSQEIRRNKDQGAENSSWRVVELSWEVEMALRELRVGNQSPGGEAASVGPGGESREKNEEKMEAWGTDRKI